MKGGMECTFVVLLTSVLAGVKGVRIFHQTRTHGFNDSFEFVRVRACVRVCLGVANAH